ncbi:MAG: hypothetical protein D3903_07735 [Candidatus Electrothrix sp. GM3_4]|nr:hypothetical protein [Candidatus Electrothrix sp. GM3_4]
MSNLQGRERSIAMNLTLAAAPKIGLKKSLQKHGADLSGRDKKALKLLKKSEILALNGINKKVSGLGIGAVGLWDTNNNNNSK